MRIARAARARVGGPAPACPVPRRRPPVGPRPRPPRARAGRARGACPVSVAVTQRPCGDGPVPPRRGGRRGVPCGVPSVPSGSALRRAERGASRAVEPQSTVAPGPTPSAEGEARAPARSRGSAAASRPPLRPPRPPGSIACAGTHHTRHTPAQRPDRETDTSHDTPHWRWTPTPQSSVYPWLYIQPPNSL